MPRRIDGWSRFVGWSTFRQRRTSDGLVDALAPPCGGLVLSRRASNVFAGVRFSRSGLAWKGVGDQEGAWLALWRLGGLWVVGLWVVGLWAEARFDAQGRSKPSDVRATGMHKPQRRSQASERLDRRGRSVLACLMDLRTVVGCFLRDGNVMWMVLPNRRRRYFDKSS